MSGSRKWWYCYGCNHLLEIKWDRNTVQHEHHDHRECKHDCDSERMVILLPSEDLVLRAQRDGIVVVREFFLKNLVISERRASRRQ